MEPPYAERHVRWCERSHGEIIPMLLLDLFAQQSCCAVASLRKYGISLKKHKEICFFSDLFVTLQAQIK